MNTKKILFINILVWGLWITHLSASCASINTSIINYLLSDSAYVPPADSIEFTKVTNTDDETMRVDRIPNGLVVEGQQRKILLVEVYGYSCPHCTAMIPVYNRLQAKYPNDVYVLTIESYGLTNAELKQYVADKEIQYDTVAVEKSGNIFSFIRSIAGQWGGVPWLLVLDRDGKLVETHLGDLPESEIDNLIQSLL